MIRKWAAAAALIGLMAVPVLRVWCEIDCASDDAQPVVAASHCHESDAASSDTALRTEDDCGAHAVQFVVLSTVKATRAIGAPLVLAVEIGPGQESRLTSSSHGYPGRAFFSSSPPHSPGRSILRI